MTTTDLSAPETQAGAGDATAAEAAAAPSRRRLLLALSLVGLLLLIALAAVTVQLLRYDSGDEQLPVLARAEARDDVLRSAAQSALNLTSIDNKEFDTDVKAVLDGATGAFRTDFEARSKDLKAVLNENEVVAQGKVIETGLVQLEGDRAVALVVVDSNVKNTAAPEGRVNSYRMKLQLERVDGRWLTSMLEFVG